MGFIGLAIALPPPSVHEVSGCQCPNLQDFFKWTLRKDFCHNSCRDSRCDWKRTCLSPDSPSTSKLPTVNQSKYCNQYCHNIFTQWKSVKILSQVTQCWSSGFATYWTTPRTTWPGSRCTLSSTPPMFIKSNRPTSTVSDCDDDKAFLLVMKTKRWNSDNDYMFIQYNSMYGWWC